jgi:hypothetical protein
MEPVDHLAHLGHEHPRDVPMVLIVLKQCRHLGPQFPPQVRSKANQSIAASTSSSTPRDRSAPPNRGTEPPTSCSRHPGYQ